MAFYIIEPRFIRVNIKFFVTSGWNIMSLHKRLCKSFASLKPCAICRGAGNDYVIELFISLKKIIYTFYQRLFRPYYNKIDLFFYTGIFDRIEISFADIQVFTILCGTSITRRSK